VANEGFAEYVSSHWRWLLRSAVLLGCSLHEAEDLAQTTLMRCYLAWPKVVRATNQDAYVAKVLINAYRQSRRRHWWRETPTAELPDAALEHDATVAVDGTETVQRALAGLTSAHREVVLLRFYMQLSERQTAEVLGISPGTVKSRLSRALAQLSTSPHLADLRNGGDS
jgi:RNA polymerase sigma-70 factor (sigma-E family)